MHTIMKGKDGEKYITWQKVNNTNSNVYLWKAEVKKIETKSEMRLDNKNSDN